PDRLLPQPRIAAGAVREDERERPRQERAQDRLGQARHQREGVVNAEEEQRAGLALRASFESQRPAARRLGARVRAQAVDGVGGQHNRRAGQKRSDSLSYGVHVPSTTRSRPARSGVATTSSKPSSSNDAETEAAVAAPTSTRSPAPR